MSTKRSQPVEDNNKKLKALLAEIEGLKKELEIEAALEKIRSRTMAMKKSEELLEIVHVVYHEIESLHIEMDVMQIYENQEGAAKYKVWVAVPDSPYPTEIRFPSFKHPLLEGLEATKNHKESCFSIKLNRRSKNSFYRKYFKLVNVAPSVKRQESLLAAASMTLAATWSENTRLALVRFTEDELTAEELSILLRFAKVFEQTYTRFLDLQKAETQAREAQIEAALERIRAAAMAMHHTEALIDVVRVLRTQMALVGETELESIVIHLYQDGADTFEGWFGYRHKDNPTGPVEEGYCIIDWNKTERARQDQEKYYSGEKDYTMVGSREFLREWYKYLERNIPQSIEYDKKGKLIVPNYLFYNYSKFAKGALLLITNEEASDRSKYLLRRAADVFNLAYTRFLDLKKAEAQAKEAQIEAALERVRAKTMAMHNSEDVSVAIKALFTELEKLGIENIRCGIAIISPDQTMLVWSVSDLPAGKTVSGESTFDMNAQPLWREIFTTWAQKDKFLEYYLSGKEKKKYFQIVASNTSYGLNAKGNAFPDMYFQGYFFDEGTIWTFSLQPHTGEEKDLMKRFTAVFSLTFRRYQDLRKAEAQAREAQIEAALERIRATSMAMHKSEELKEVITLTFDQLIRLDFKVDGCFIDIFEPGSRDLHLWIATPQQIYDKMVDVPHFNHPLFKKLQPTKKGSESFFKIVLDKKRMAEWRNHLLTKTEFKRVVTQNRRKEVLRATTLVGSLAVTKHHGLIAYNFQDHHYTYAENEIVKRFSQVFEQAYVRFLDLQKAERQEQEAQKKASLDRVRGQIASMRSTEDLERITPLIWNELTTLGVPFIRCGVFIIDEVLENVEVYLSDPEGHALAAMNLPFDSNPLTKDSVDHWRQGKVYRTHWSQTDFINWTQYLMKVGQVKDKIAYQGAIAPPKSLDLHYIPFTQGMLYVGSINSLHEDEIELVKSLAEAFAIAYARYEDFVKLEKAKENIESTFSELKSTQSQLIQSEKMASLGELTAGIAHEIQNPLNFVNNFSEVSGELLEEIKEEIENGNVGDAREIVQDLIQNLEKINHHGQRASSIVKGMLQHSRASTEQKEPTDINALADEYLRLAYHGLRAKDRSFNATMETDYDESIIPIEVIPQDIGRVILNLITNAFHTVNEKNNSRISDYVPTVTVSTQGVKDKVRISVKDNGNGIPNSMKEKVFQPFFTTKPTGQGTGLGLSMSYDIITEGHSGQLTLESKEGKGSTFTIVLPKA